MNKKIFNFVLIFIVSFFLMNEVKAVYSDANIGKYEDELNKFPLTYQDKIKELHNIYPNAVFVKQDKFFDWNKFKEVEVDWNDMLKAQSSGKKSEIEASAPSNHKSSTCGEYSGDRCTWYVASKEAIEYYMNPYNFLDESHVFMFESQYYKDYHIKEGVEKIFAGTFMGNKNCEGSDKTYAEVVLEAAAKYNVSPYMLAARLKQEQGSKGTSSLISGKYEGYEGLYNYFNIQASGSTDEAKITNGLKCASGTLVSSKGTKLCDGNSWTSPYLSIIGGAKFIYKDYIGVNDTYNVKGQMTNYLQKWDPYGPVFAGHQYMQNIRAPYFESQSTFKSYSSFEGYKNYNYVFYIPIFKNAPNLTYEVKNENNIPNNTVNVKLGDVNGDGVIDSGDLFKLQQYLIGKVSFNDNQKKSADTNRDNEINSGDIFKLVQHLIGKINLNG